MKLPEILGAFHTMPTCDRLDLICRLLRSCVPFELRFLGTVLLDAAHAQMKSFSALEVVANQVNHYAGFKSGALTHEVCEKLCCALAVVHAHNNPVAEAMCGILDNPQVLQLFDETSDVKILNDLRLLYVMAVNHPALSFNQRQQLLYRYLQRMDSVYRGKRKFLNLSSSTESGEGDGSATLRREPGKDAFVTSCEVHSVYKRADKRYPYMIQVEWSDGTSSCVRRTYGDFFSFHTKLLDQFPEEGGQKHKKERMIPFLPGKYYPRLLTNSRDLAEKRLPELHRYAKELLMLPEKICRCEHVLEFFRPRPEDLREEYPPVEKITNLYDLLESGKARLRNYTDPLVGGKGVSPGSSPQIQRSSPLHRASAENTPTTQSRTAHTLPHQSTSSTSQAKEEAAGLERRFTYPSRRSAFTPVTPPQQHETPPAPTHLTNSHPSIANGTSTSSTAESTSMELVAGVTNTSPKVVPATATPSLPTPSQVTSSQLSREPAITTATTSAISVISSSHHHTVTPSSNIAKPTPTYAPSPSFPSAPSPTKPLHHFTHPHILHRPPVVPSPPPPLQSAGKTTPIGELPYFPVGAPLPLFNPIIIGYGSPIHSPSPSPLTPGVLRGKSSSNISRTPTEYESLTRWLKSLRLHKYAPIFENMTFDELLSMNKESLKRKGMTEGAANKLVGKIEELKAQNFTGFRDMPYNPRMSRKPSTCSLPAALLTDNRVTTPSSSVDGLSPTDSTCSLDKAALIVSQASGSMTDMFYTLNGAESPAGYDITGVKVTQGGSGKDGTLKGSVVSPPLSVTSPSSPLSPPATSSNTESDVSKSTLTRSSVGGAVGVSKSWADRLDDAGEDEREARTPEWAILHRDSRVRSSTPSHPTKLAQHTPVNKRHSAEPSDGWSHSDPVTFSRASYHPTSSRSATGSGQSANWLPRPPGPPLLQNSHFPPGVGWRHRGPPQPVTALGVNGLVPTLAPTIGVPHILQRSPYLAGMPAYAPIMANHSRGTVQPPPPMCFNCGKKGHHGASCPAETIDTNNPDMFHRQLERLNASRQNNSSSSHNSHHRHT